MIKVAFINSSMPVNGVSTVIMNYCEKLDKNKYEISIFTSKPIDNMYLDCFKKNNVTLYELPPKRGGNPFKYYRFLLKNIKKEKFDIVHIHGNSATITIELLIAFLNGVKVRIAHCHNTQCDKKIAHHILKPFLKLFYTKGYACSQEAGKWMFGSSPFKVMNNGFDTKKFKFHENKRNIVRKKLGLENNFVIGHVGMFNYQKNHEFMLEIFDSLIKIVPNAVLLLVGTGPDFEKIKDQVKDKDYKDNIIFYGLCSNVEELYCAMDSFIFPSRYEGLGIVLVEAQINGLPCFASEYVPRGAMINNQSVKFLSLNDKNSWVDSLNECLFNNKRDDFYKNNIDFINKFEINHCIKELENDYSNLVK